MKSINSVLDQSKQRTRLREKNQAGKQGGKAVAPEVNMADLNPPLMAPLMDP